MDSSAVEGVETATAGPNGREQLDVAVAVVASVWSEVLGIETPDPEDDFFILGGDSLAALAVSKRLTELGGGSWPEDGIVAGELAYVNLWQHRILRDLADYLLTCGATRKWPLSVQSGESVPEESKDSDDPDQPATKDGEGKREGTKDGGDGSPPAAQMSEAEVAIARQKHRELRSFAARGMLDPMRQLLSAGVHPSGGEGREAPILVGVSALHAAANAGQGEAVEELLQHGAAPNAKMFFYKRTAAHCAAAAGCLPALQALHSAGAALRAKDKSRLSLLHDAARSGSAACIHWLLRASCAPDMDARDKWGRTPLHWTVLNGHAHAAAALVQAGAKLEPAKMPHRIQRRRTSLLQPPSLASLARQFHPPDHPLHAILSPPPPSGSSAPSLPPSDAEPAAGGSSAPSESESPRRRNAQEDHHHHHR
mmetsp:Transcript_15027/g.35423  ORF Transcript_15027/g.35423 Transcript_15027/m.35423 type:complete len:425 (-) Transcript_15027:220-1494(-)